MTRSRDGEAKMENVSPPRRARRDASLRSTPRRNQLRSLPPFCVADAAGARRGDARTDRHSPARLHACEMEKGRVWPRARREGGRERGREARAPVTSGGKQNDGRLGFHRNGPDRTGPLGENHDPPLFRRCEEQKKDSLDSLTVKGSGSVSSEQNSV